MSGACLAHVWCIRPFRLKVRGFAHSKCGRKSEGLLTQSAGENQRACSLKVRAKFKGFAHSKRGQKSEGLLTQSAGKIQRACSLKVWAKVKEFAHSGSGAVSSTEEYPHTNEHNYTCKSIHTVAYQSAEEGSVRLR
jgi:hypothetical protein